MVFHHPEGSMSTKFSSCPRGFSALCPSSPFPHWEQQDPSMVINIRIWQCKFSFNLCGAHLENDTESLRWHVWLSYCDQYWVIHFWKGKAYTSIERFVFAKAKHRTTVEHQGPYSAMCANLALQGNFQHVSVTSQTRSYYSTAFLVPPHNPHRPLLGTTSIQ